MDIVTNLNAVEAYRGLRNVETQVLALIFRDESLNVQQVADILSVTTRRVYQAAKLLEHVGLVEASKRANKNTDWTTAKLTELGLQVYDLLLLRTVERNCRTLYSSA